MSRKNLKPITQEVAINFINDLLDVGEDLSAFRFYENYNSAYKYTYISDESINDINVLKSIVSKYNDYIDINKEDDNDFVIHFSKINIEYRMSIPASELYNTANNLFDIQLKYIYYKLNEASQRGNTYTLVDIMNDKIMNTLIEAGFAVENNNNNEMKISFDKYYN